MGKPVLGKGLNQLMSGQKVARKPATPDTAAEKVTRVDFGRGLNTLVTPAAAESAESTNPRFLLPAWFFFAADVLLLAYTVVICANAGGPLQFGELLFAFVSTTLAALLGAAGVIRARS
jgi:hypothetical protein